MNELLKEYTEFKKLSFYSLAIFCTFAVILISTFYFIEPPYQLLLIIIWELARLHQRTETKRKALLQQALERIPNNESRI